MKYLYKSAIHGLTILILIIVSLFFNLLPTSAAEKKIKVGEFIQETVTGSLEQLNHVTDPQRKLSEYEYPHFTCRETMDDDDRIAARKPDAIFSYLYWWFFGAREVSKELKIPLPVCFNPKCYYLSVEGGNTIEFNNILIDTHREEFVESEFFLNCYVGRNEKKAEGERRKLGKIRVKLVRSLINRPLKDNIDPKKTKIKIYDDDDPDARKVYFTKQK